MQLMQKMGKYSHFAKKGKSGESGLIFLADLGMTEEDTLLLMLVTLFTQDSPSGSAKNGEKIDLAKKYFVDKMMDHMEKRRAGSAPEGLLLLPMLRSIKNSFMEVLTSLSVRYYVTMTS